MELFEKIKDNLDSNISKLNKEFDALKKSNILFMDVETEGTILGYKRASKEYEPKLKILENEYNDLKRVIESEKDIYESKCDDLINKLYGLKKEKDDLQVDLDEKAQYVSTIYNIPIDKIYASVKYGDLWEGFIHFGIFNYFNVVGIIYGYKKRKLKKSEIRGYLEAKKLYEEKIKKLKYKLEQLKGKGDKEIKELLILIIDILDEITKKKTSIVQLGSLI